MELKKDGKQRHYYEVSNKHGVFLFLFETTCLITDLNLNLYKFLRKSATNTVFYVINIKKKSNCSQPWH